MIETQPIPFGNTRKTERGAKLFLARLTVRTAPSASVATLAILLAGCSRAPSIDIIGSFFPAWLICLVAGVVLTFVVRAILVKLGLDTEVGPPALFYPSLLTLLTGALWLAFFR